MIYGVGVIASDIDGTLTNAEHMIPREVAHYLQRMQEQGWHICLITGRTLSFTETSIQHLRIPYYLAVQNGAEVFRMPNKDLLFQHFLTKNDLILIDSVCAGVEEDFIVYSGAERGDFCYYRTEYFSEALLHYLERIEPIAHSRWQKIISIEDISQEGVPLVKYFGSQSILQKLAEKLAVFPQFNVAILPDTLDPSIHLLLITARQVDKGKALKFLINEYQWKGPIIVAGDQDNDIPLFREGEYKIAMKGGSPLLLANADIIAPSAEKLGIIWGLQQVLHLLEKTGYR